MKIGLLSLGCPKNLIDGEVMLGLAREAGHQITAHAADADVVVVNTCAFIDNAKQESVNAILEMAANKTSGRRLVVTGCLAERYRDELRREIPEIDAVLGTGEVSQIVAACEGPGAGDRVSGRGNEALDGAGQGTTMPLRFLAKPAGAGVSLHAFERAAPHPGPPTYLYDADTPRLLTTPRHYAYLKIAEGCDYTCAFCIIPTLRGAYRSRTIESIVREAHGLVAQGVRELLLVSQDTSFFGIDRGDRGALARLLRELDRVDGLTWVRLLYLYPTTVTDDVLAAMAECPKVCRYVDLPLQHASAPVLARMRRPGSRAVYDKLIRRIRDRVPGVSLRTTFIVGFPGETEQDFADLDAFVAETSFDHLGVFTYSHEEGTRAFALPDDVPARVKRQRRNTLMARQRRMVAAAQRRRKGLEVEILVDGPSAEHPLVLQGRTEWQAPDIDPVVYLTDCNPADYRAGQLIKGTVVDARGYDLVAAPAPVGPAC